MLDLNENALLPPHVCEMRSNVLRQTQPQHAPVPVQMQKSSCSLPRR